MLKNFFGEKLPKTVFISSNQLNDLRERLLYGKYFKDTQIFNVFPEGMKGNIIGKITKNPDDLNKYNLIGLIENNKIIFKTKNYDVEVETYDLYQNIFSRNTGILETKVMSEKNVVILGCGSVGSLVAMELARSGVGNFLLVDSDTLEYHNLCRHQCGLEDVGDLKVNAVERKLKNINPAVNVVKFGDVIQNAPEKLISDFCSKGSTIFIGCADNRSADVYSNRIAMLYNASFLSIGFWERAYAGEIFYHIPGKNMPCYKCALGDGSNVSGRVEANHHVYSTQENLEKVKFEPGISVDINFITCIGIKLAIDILNVNNKNYIPRLLNNLRQYTLVCNTSNPEIAGEMVEIFSYPLQVTTSLKVGFGKDCESKCKDEM